MLVVTPIRIPIHVSVPDNVPMHLIYTDTSTAYLVPKLKCKHTGIHTCKTPIRIDTDSNVNVIRMSNVSDNRGDPPRPRGRQARCHPGSDIDHRKVLHTRDTLGPMPQGAMSVLLS